MGFQYICIGARGCLRLHAVYGTNGNFSEKFINEQFIQNVLLPHKLEHGLPIILFFKIKNFCLLYFTSFSFSTPFRAIKILSQQIRSYYKFPSGILSLLADWGEQINPCVCGREFTVQYLLLFLLNFKDSIGSQVSLMPNF